jgi:dephospho-CoA kinase
MGSGKSTVRRLMELHGVTTVDSDSIGHQVLEPDGPAFPEVARQWPGVVVGEHIDRTALAGIVFSDPVQLALLETLTHPHIFGRITSLLQEIDPPVVVEIPLLHKTPPGAWRRLVVDCDDETRLARLLERGMGEDEARRRMAVQPSRGEWLAHADLVIPNHGSEEELASTVGQAIEAVLTR